jgi:glycosyltransferase involved in cell wall biosynthesis
MNYLSVVSRCFVDGQGGAPRVAWDMCKIMQERGHNVTMFCQKENVKDNEICEVDGIRVIRFEFPRTAALDPFKVYKQINAGTKVARKYLLNTKWDVVHVHLPIEGRIIFKLIGTGPRYIYTVHSPSVLEQKFNWSQQGIRGKVKILLGTGAMKKIEGNLLRNADCIQTLSEFTKTAIDGFYDVGSKIRVIPHWCRKDFVRRHSKAEARTLLAWPQDAKILFTLRHFGPRYGLDIAIRAAAPLLKKYTCLRFALGGYGPLKQTLMQLAKNLGVDDKIWFMGRVSDDVLRQCYEAADMFILPTRALECFGLIVLEAFAYGLPIISTDAGALPELIRPISPDMIVPAGQIEPLQRKIEAFVNGSLKEPVPEVIIDYVQKKYSYEVIVPRIVEMLEGA